MNARLRKFLKWKEEKTKRKKLAIAKKGPAFKASSQMYKTAEVQLDDTLSYINSDQTPGKSILKKSNAERKLDFETENFGSSDDVNEISALIERLIKEEPKCMN
ncbi:unnamed protein product [Lasius platythorax]|uniref:Uncharacterized protein n=1 Tax=Lasius platythorax TaxID=488582 RepID=A0AAV2MY33_9HYME